MCGSIPQCTAYLPFFSVLAPDYMDPKKRKIDIENRSFLAEWIEQYCFTLPDRPQAIPVSLICNKTVAIVKSGDLKRHYETTHQQFLKNCPLGSQARKEKIQTYLSSYEKSTKLLVRCMSVQENTTEAALRVCWTLNKHQKPFSDSEIMKECMLAVVTSLFEEKKMLSLQFKVFHCQRELIHEELKFLLWTLKTLFLNLFKWHLATP
nr:EPM2A-interacting protein 1-like [Leptinotarsa decemlineata]